jgi:hypothetical protein
MSAEKECPMSEVTIHRLLKKDPDTRTGECSVCGLVAIRKAGNGFMCGEKKKATQKAWREKNPEKAATNRRQRSPHALFNRDYVHMTAECVRCGPVQMAPYGRGYACGVRAQQIRDGQEVGPQRPCRECWVMDGDKVWLRGDGKCARCEDRRQYDTGAALRDAEHRADQLDGVPAGFSVVDISVDDPYDMPEFESAVPGWRTVGSDRPWNEV